MNPSTATGPAASTTQYFKPLFSFSPSVPGGFDISAIVPLVFLVIFITWVIYTLIAAYHWFRYGHQSWVAVPALALHIFVSGAIIIYMLTGLH